MPIFTLSRKLLPAAVLAGGLGLALALALAGLAVTVALLGRPAPRSTLSTSDGPNYNAGCRYNGCAWVLSTTSQFITADTPQDVYAWYWANRRV